MCEICPVTKRFTARRARIGLLPGVYSYVFTKVPNLSESFPTLIAAKGFLSRMRPQMLDQADVLAEGFLTFVTDEWFLSSVNPMMLVER